MKNLDILSLKLFFLIMTPLREMKEGVYSSISLASMVVDLKMVSKKFLGPSNLIRAQTFYIHELTKVVIIDQDKDIILAAF